MMGTPHYISPEQARGDRELDFRADIYSLGCTLFQMLTGQVPYGGTDAIAIIRQHFDAPLPAILKVWPQYPLPLARLVGKMLKKARPERHGSYEELIAQMKSVWAQIDPAGFEPESFAPPVRRAASAADERPPSAPLPPPPARSPLPLYGGIAAGVAVLAVVAWLVWPKTEQLTQTQLVMAQRAAAKSAAPATPAPTASSVAETKVPAAPAGTAPEPAAIKLWDAPDKIPKYEGVRWEDNALRLSNALEYHEHLSRDAILRASIRMNPDAQTPQICLRYSKEHRYIIVIQPKEGFIRLQKPIDSSYPDIKSWPLPRAYGAEEWARLELRAVGNTLTVSLDGQVLGTVHDSSITEPGGVFLAGNNGYFRAIEYVPLDGAAAAPSAPATSALPAARYPQPREWKDRTDGIRSEGLKTGELVVDGGWLTLAPGKKQHSVGLSSTPYSDVAIRVVFANEAYVALRVSDLDGYNLGIAKDAKIWLHRKGAGTTDLKSGIGLGAGYVAAAEHEIVFAAQGDKLTLWVDGKEAASVRDGSYRTGTMVIDFHYNSRIKKIETGELEAVGTAPAAATKDAPFVNTLGMKFVPVPITGGPTGGQRVLFSVWETRVQDYEVFAMETKRKWDKWPGFDQGPTHPAVNIDWEAANAFCAWLTGRERTAGRIGATEAYRLPSDHEWSCAVGIGEREDAAKRPSEKDGKIADVSRGAARGHRRSMRATTPGRRRFILRRMAPLSITTQSTGCGCSGSLPRWTA